jgi:hypothetical protein
VRAEASKDGAAHVACGVFEGASMACGEMKDGYNYNFVSAGEPNAFRAYGCALPAEAERGAGRGDGGHHPVPGTLRACCRGGGGRAGARHRYLIIVSIDTIR